MSAPEPRSPLVQALKPGRHGAVGARQVTLRAYRRSLVQLQARKGRAADLATAVRQGLGLALPPPGRAETSPTLAAIWIQPSAWLLCAPYLAEGDLARSVRAAVGSAGAVVDQTHGKSVLRLSGPTARAVLETGCRIDLHPRAFAPGQAAATPVGHIDCILRQLDNAPSYELIVASTLAEAFVDWLLHAAAAYGCEVLPPD
ncbi:MAG: sarcosine oxidase subunit gamma [Alphaproteobacteria bacterium]|nr:sarcosine oxidase subunit gamma [Alphaproteobacteria bacterium]